MATIGSTYTRRPTTQQIRAGTGQQQPQAQQAQNNMRQQTPTNWQANMPKPNQMQYSINNPGGSTRPPQTIGGVQPFQYGGQQGGGTTYDSGGFAGPNYSQEQRAYLAQQSDAAKQWMAQNPGVKQGDAAYNQFFKNYDAQHGGMPGQQQQQIGGGGQQPNVGNYYGTGAGQQAIAGYLQQQQQQPQAQTQPTGVDQWGNDIYNSKDKAGTWLTNALQYAQHGAQSSGQLGNYLNQQQDPYAALTGQAQGYLGNLFGGQGGSPSDNPFLQTGQGLLTQGQGMLGGGGQPQAPNITGAPTSYNPPPQLTTQQFNPASVQGPNVQNVSAQQFGARDVTSNVNTGIPGWDQLAQMGGNANPLAREQFGPERFNQDPLSQQAFSQAMSQAQSLGGGNVPDVQSTYDNLLKQAATAGANKAGGRGFTDLSGTMAGRSIGQELGLTAERLGPQIAANQLEAARLGQQGQQAATSALTNIGQSSAGAANAANQLNLQSGLGYGGLNVDQRGQDYSFLGQGQNKLSDVASLVNAVSGANLGAGQQNLAAQQSNQAADLTAGQANQNAALQAGMANQNAGLQGYNELANMIGTQGNIWNQGQQNANQAGQINANTGLGYSQLGAQNQNQYNQQLIDLYNAQGNQGNQYQQNQNQLLNTLLGGAGGFANTYQGGQQNQMQNQIQIGQLAQQALQGGQAGQQAKDQLYAAALNGDRDAYNQIYQNGFAQEFQAYEAAKTRTQGGGGIGGFLGSAVGTIAGSALGPVGAAVGNQVGGWIGGGGNQPSGGYVPSWQRQQLNLGGG